MAIGSKLTDLMKIRGTNANELAQAVGVAPTTIYSLIKRDGTKTDINLLARISSVLDVDLIYFSDNLPQADEMSEETMTAAVTPSYDFMHGVIARGSKSLTDKERMQLIRLLTTTQEKE